MTSLRWPLPRLWLRTPALELRWPTASDVEELAELAAGGVHDPQTQPFIVAWTDAAPEERGLGTMQHLWSQWASWQPSNWSVSFAVVRDGTVVGIQRLGARDFGVLRQVGTGSWLGRQYHGQGIGTEMRAAVLHLAFEGLGAQCAVSGALEGNAASLSVSRKLGYRDGGARAGPGRSPGGGIHPGRRDQAAGADRVGRPDPGPRLLSLPGRGRTGRLRPRGGPGAAAGRAAAATHVPELGRSSQWIERGDD
jgi:RimJ/RimL family protein N-acetyltransferase